MKLCCGALAPSTTVKLDSSAGKRQARKRPDYFLISSRAVTPVHNHRQEIGEAEWDACLACQAPGTAQATFNQPEQFEGCSSALHNQDLEMAALPETSESSTETSLSTGQG